MPNDRVKTICEQQRNARALKRVIETVEKVWGGVNQCSVQVENCDFARHCTPSKQIKIGDTAGSAQGQGRETVLRAFDMRRKDATSRAA
jgi:hypothetical protein